jgi:hypothetical protein
MERGKDLSVTRDNAADIKRIIETPMHGRIDAANLILVTEGLKPATGISLFYYKEGEKEYSEEDFYLDIQGVYNLLEELGLPYDHAIEKATEEYPYDIAFFEVGKDEEALQQLHEANNEQTAVEKHMKLGKAYGYPETMIEAYTTGRLMKKNELPEDLKNDPVVKFVNFYLSKDHWEEELEWVRGQMEVIRRKAPKLYEEIVNS